MQFVSLTKMFASGKILQFCIGGGWKMEASWLNLGPKSVSAFWNESLSGMVIVSSSERLSVSPLICVQVRMIVQQILCPVEQRASDEAGLGKFHLLHSLSSF